MKTQNCIANKIQKIELPKMDHEEDLSEDVRDSILLNQNSIAKNFGTSHTEFMRVESDPTSQNRDQFSRVHVEAKQN